MGWFFPWIDNGGVGSRGIPLLLYPDSFQSGVKCNLILVNLEHCMLLPLEFSKHSGNSIALLRDEFPCCRASPTYI